MQITIDLTDTLQSEVLEQANQLNITIETLILNTIKNRFAPPPILPVNRTIDEENDPLLKLIGTLHLGTTDLGENHDYYLQQALIQELNPRE